ncbi:MAG: hypothetical protein RR320_05650 [Oscillospiraceae bacterium]
MKTYVSLLPIEYRQELQRDQKIRFILRAMIGAAAVLLVITMIFFALRFFGKSKMEDLHQQNEAIEQQIMALSGYETSYQELQNLRRQIHAASQNDPQWLSAISAITETLPRGVWVEGLRSVLVEGQKKCELNCGANTLDDISNALLALSQSKSVQEVYCSSSSEQNGQVSFTLSVTLAQAAN